LLEFTRLTGDLIKAMRGCPKLIVAAIDGICAGAGHLHTNPRFHPCNIGSLAVIGPTGCRYLNDARQLNYVKGGWNYLGDASTAMC